MPSSGYWNVYETIKGRSLNQFCSSRHRKGKDSRFSRAYINFRTLPSLLAFSKAFDNHAFIDSKGTEYRAVVEFAPSQRLPKLKKRKDAKQGTIAGDPHYIKFLEALSDPTKDMPSLLGTVEAEPVTAATGEKSVAPLIAYLREKKAGQVARKAKKDAANANVKLLKRDNVVPSGAKPVVNGGKPKEGPTNASIGQGPKGRKPKPPPGTLPIPSISSSEPPASPTTTSGRNRQRKRKEDAQKPPQQGGNPQQGAKPNVVIKKADGSMRSFDVGGPGSASSIMAAAERLAASSAGPTPAQACAGPTPAQAAQLSSGPPPGLPPPIEKKEPVRGMLAVDPAAIASRGGGGFRGRRGGRGGRGGGPPRGGAPGQGGQAPAQSSGS